MASAAEQLAANLNFGAFAKATELKRRILFTLGALVIYRLGSYIPIPGIDPVALQAAFQQEAGGLLGMLNMFAGGALGRMTIFALNIMPYISASIIIQLLTAVSPTLDQLKKEGENWRLMQPVQGRADSAEVGSLLTRLSSGQMQAIVAEEPATLDVYGLRPPRTTVTATGSGKTLAQVFVGSPSGDAAVHMRDASRPYLRRALEVQSATGFGETPPEIAELPR